MYKGNVNIKIVDIPNHNSWIISHIIETLYSRKKIKSIIIFATNQLIIEHQFVIEKGMR